jgi:hypothetical protein
MREAGRACYPPARMRKGLLAFTVGLTFLSCGKLNEITAPPPPVEPPDPSATFTRVQTEIFTPTCAVIGCHDPAGQANSAGLNLRPGTAYAQIVGTPSSQMPQLRRVAPNDPDNSYLYRKITGVGIISDRMPQASPPLSDAQIRLVRDWIRRGAPND